MAHVTVTAQFFYGYYYFFMTKSNSDLCCHKFRPTTEIVYFQAPHESPCGALFLSWEMIL